MQGTITTNNSNETQALAGKISQEVKHGGIVCLYGDLGSGKTTFTQGFAKALGIEQHVNSPSFLIIREYDLARGTGRRAKSFYHVDLYRLESEKETDDIGLREILENPENIVVIEWAEKLGALLPQKRIDIHFEYLDENKRKIVIKQYQ